MLQVYIVRDTELGWDNVIGVYTSEEAAEKAVVYRGGSTSFWDTELLEEEFKEY